MVVEGLRGASPLVPKDLDLEVHGLTAPDLERLLRGLGSVSLVGQSFAVYKLNLGLHEIDVSLPRRDSVRGAGHRGIHAIGDPFMGLAEAARRRDLTINAMAFDPLSGVVEDPWGGQEDLRARRLREVDPLTFGEDPLRALRVPQLAARLQFHVTPGLLALCAAMPLHELPAERVGGELRKLLSRAPQPSWGLTEDLCAAVWRRLHPALAALDWEPARTEVDRAAHLRRARWPQGGPWSEALMV
jgi:tRNA nucleotidyltransferase (CCA-adding enzyme)